MFATATVGGLGNLPPSDPLTIEYVRTHGVIVGTDGTVATVEVKQGAVVSYVLVTLNADGSIANFIPRPKLTFTASKFTMPPPNGDKP